MSVSKLRSMMVAALFLGGAAGVVAQDSGPTLESLKSGYEKRRAQIGQPVSSLNAKYDATLEKMQAAAQTSGRLEEMILIRTEREGFEKGEHVEIRSGELKRQQTIYVRERARLKRIEDAALDGLQRKYVSALEGMVGKLTRSRQIEAAVAVRNELAPVKAEVEERAARKVEEAAPVRDLLKLKPVRTDGTHWFRNSYKEGKAATVDGKKYKKSESIFAHAPSAITWEFEEPATRFESLVTVAAENGYAAFKVLVGDEVVYETEPISGYGHRKIEVRFEPTRTITLVTDPAGVDSSDHTLWIQPWVK